MPDDILFYPYRLSCALTNRTKTTRKWMMQLTPDRMSGASDNELVECFATMSGKEASP
jgi:hypothetical protein